MKFSTFSALVVASLAALSTSANAAWVTVYNQASGTTNQLRSVAVANDNATVYAGFIQTSGNRRVNQFDTSSPFTGLSSYVSGGDQPKGIDTDDRGYVFVANRGSGTTSSTIRSHTSDLTPVPLGVSTATSPVIGGLSVVKSGANYYAYTVYEAGGLVQRYDVTDPASITLDTTFGLGGSYIVPGASNLRGVEVASDGTIFVASRDDSNGSGTGVVYKVAADLSSVTSTGVNRAIDLALYNGQVYVTSYAGTSSAISILNQSDLSAAGSVAVTTLDGNPYSRGTSEGFSGIDIDGFGRIWLADQHYGSTGGTQDRLIMIPEPASLSVLAGVAMMGLRRRRA